MRASLSLPLLSLLVAAAAAGCGEDFVPFSRLTSARVLAISAEPSMPGPGETTTLRAFVYVPEIGAGVEVPGVTYSWSWCPLPDPQGGPCQISPEQIAMFAQAGITLPPLDLGQAPSASFTHSINADALKQICAGLPGVPALLDCEGGFPVQIRMTAKFPATMVGTTTIAADEIVTVSTLRLRFDPSHQPNVSPSIEGLSAIFGTKETGEEVVPIGVEPAALLPRDEETVIRAAVPVSSIEIYNGLDDDLKPRKLFERLTLTWFVESGDLDEERTSFADNERKELPEFNASLLDRFEKNLRNKWSPAITNDYPKAFARVVVIARDNRGGVAWRDGFVNLAETP